MCKSGWDLTLDMPYKKQPSCGKTWWEQHDGLGGFFFSRGKTDGATGQSKSKTP